MTDQVGASHILIMHKESERSSATRIESEALELINDIKKQVEMGEDFPALAKEHSDCPSSCLLYTSPSPRDRTRSRMPSSA